MFIIQALADAARWLAEGLAAVWQPIEPVAIALYLIVIALLGLWVCYQSGRGAKILGAAILVMIVGEAFRLIPRIIADIAPPGAFPAGAFRNVRGCEDAPHGEILLCPFRGDRDDVLRTVQ